MDILILIIYLSVPKNMADEIIKKHANLLQAKEEAEDELDRVNKKLESILLKNQDLEEKLLLLQEENREMVEKLKTLKISAIKEEKNDEPKIPSR